MASDYQIKPRQLRALILLLVLLPLFPTAIAIRFMIEATLSEQHDIRERLNPLYTAHLSTLGNFLQNRLLTETLTLKLDAPPEKVFQSAVQNFYMDGLLVFSLEDESAVFPASPPPIFAATKLKDALLLSQSRLERLPSASPLLTWPPNTWKKLPGMQTVFGMALFTDQHLFICLRQEATLIEVVEEFYRSALGSDVQIVVSTNLNTPTKNSSISRQPLASQNLSHVLPGWEVAIFPSQTGLLKQSFWQQTQFYLSFAVGLLLIILLVALLAGHAISKQIKLHELRNSTIASVAHELKTPVTSIRLLLETLKDTPNPSQSQIQDYLDLMLHENTRISRIVQNFLTHARMESGLFAPDLQPLNLYDPIQLAVESLHIQLEPPHCQFSLNVSSDLPPVLGHTESLTTLFVNLLENALKYSTPPPVISLASEVTPTHVHITIQDQGIGIPENEISQIFFPFHQLDSRLSRSQEGCGLGLSIVQHIVRHHHASIQVTSTPGSGSTFSISFPVHSASAPVTNSSHHAS